MLFSLYWRTQVGRLRMLDYFVLYVVLALETNVLTFAFSSVRSWKTTLRTQIYILTDYYVGYSFREP